VKQKSEELSGLDAQRTDFTAIEQSWVFPSDIKAMATTNPKFGISLKDLVGTWFAKGAGFKGGTETYSCSYHI
jgi:hypothetical protein